MLRRVKVFARWFFSVASTLLTWRRTILCIRKRTRGLKKAVKHHLHLMRKKDFQWRCLLWFSRGQHPTTPGEPDLTLICLFFTLPKSTQTNSQNHCLDAALLTRNRVSLLFRFLLARSPRSRKKFKKAFKLANIYQQKAMYWVILKTV